MRIKIQNQKTKSNSILTVVKYGDPILRKPVEDITDFTSLPNMTEQMFNTMYEENGIGLAANQVGWSLNLSVLDTSNEEGEIDNGPYIFINSKVIKIEGTIVLEEGCLSVPDIRAGINRPETITLRYQDLYQKFHENTFRGIISRIIQHELDHLQGKLFIDYLSPSKRILINKRLLEIAENGIPSTGIIL